MHVFNRNKWRGTHEQRRHKILFTTALLNSIYTAAFLRLTLFLALAHFGAHNIDKQKETWLGKSNNSCVTT